MNKISPWNDVLDQLTPATRQLLDLPDYAQATANPYSMSNFAPVVQPVIDCLQPKHLCEIGSERGVNTRYLLDYCAANKARLTIVDPKLGQLETDVEKQFATVHNELSVDFLSRPNDIDVFFLDGDHNYETVLAELSLIRDNAHADAPLCVFMDDTSWPCARRDLYYDTSNVKSPHDFASGDIGVSPFSESLVECTGFGHESTFAIATSEGGPKNGVLTALEDFLKEPGSAGWEYVSIPSLYGLSIVWDDNRLTTDQRAEFQRVSKCLTELRPFLATLELNRIILFQSLLDAGNDWKKQRAAVAKLEAHNAELKCRLDEVHYLIRIHKLLTWPKRLLKR